MKNSTIVARPTDNGLDQFFPYDPLKLQLPEHQIRMLREFAEDCNSYARGQDRWRKYNNNTFFRQPYSWVIFKLSIF